MNGKLIVGILALAGIGACIYYFICRRKPKESAPQNQKTDYLPKAVVSSSEKAADTLDDAKEKLAEEKRDAAMSIQKRHEEAAKEMKESLNHIIDDTPISETENTETLNEMMDDLDKLMD